MKISVFGLGYVGIVTASNLAAFGHHVVGVDINQHKVDLMNKRISPIVEDGLLDILSDSNLSISATRDGNSALRESDVVFVCVGTPTVATGATDMGYVDRIMSEIFDFVEGNTEKELLVILRSTVVPGSCDKFIQQSEKRGLKGRLNIVFNPEFLREGSAVKDFRDPELTVFGITDDSSKEMLDKLFFFLGDEFVYTSYSVAEMMKFASNAWHATKITFANEVARFANLFPDMDSEMVMKVLCLDKKLNISKAYMKPGFAYGGSCLPKDVRSLCSTAKRNGINLPLLMSLNDSNEEHIEFALRTILDKTPLKQTIGIYGLSFKKGTDDLRESPSLILVKRLLGEGYEVKIYDEFVNESKLVGSNRAYLEANLPHINRLLVNDEDELLDNCDALIVVHQPDAQLYEKLGRINGQIFSLLSSDSFEGDVTRLVR